MATVGQASADGADRTARSGYDSVIPATEPSRSQPPNPQRGKGNFTAAEPSTSTWLRPTDCVEIRVRLHGEYAVQSTAGAAMSAYVAAALMAPGNPVREYLNAAPDESMAAIFENLVADGAARIWGDAGKALRFGWPSDIGRPPEFDLAIRWLAQKVGVDVGQGYRQPRRKDGGVDVVAWRPFPDGRSGFPVLLVQCTLQENLLAKGMDVDTRLWGSWLAMDVDPTAALATATALPPGTIWNELALKYMVLDRIRLVGLAEATVTDELAVDWVASTINDLREHMGEIGEM